MVIKKLTNAAALFTQDMTVRKSNNNNATNDLNFANYTFNGTTATPTTTTTITRQHPTQRMSAILLPTTATTSPRNTNNMMTTSTNSLTDSCSGNCPLTHQYHYIQYPAHYHYINHQPTPMNNASKTAAGNANCHCCTCGGSISGGSEQQLYLHQYQSLYNEHLPNCHAHAQHHGHSNIHTHANTQTAHIHSQQNSVDSQTVSVVVHTGNGENTTAVTAAANIGATAAAVAGGGSGGGGGATAACADVDEQQNITKAKSEQSLLNHSYQALQLQTTDLTNTNNNNNNNNSSSSSSGGSNSNKIQNSKLKDNSCECDLECICGQKTTQAILKQHKNKQHCNGVADAMLGVDDITVSESDNNSSMTTKKKSTRNGKKYNSWCGNDVGFIPDKSYDSNYNSSHLDIYSDGDGERLPACFKDNNGETDETDLDQRPPLPPRPMPRPRNIATNGNANHRHQHGIKKYVVWCLVCGGFSCIVGILFLGVYFLLHSYTITVGNFETVPTFVPATLLILTGGCIMSLARRKNRYSYLIKLSGACGLISALTCAFVTVTTTVLHMTRLQALRECEYAQKTRTCTCYSDIMETSQVDRVDKEGVRLVFDSLSDCGVVHGSLYSCLRAIFGLSVAGVLIAVFSCMLVYQLLSHERKKMYWEQLELRCRSLYTSQQGPSNAAALSNAPNGQICRCCEQCHAHRSLPLQTTTYPWDDSGEPRFWTGQPPGNFYSPNPGGDVLHPGGGPCTSHHNHHAAPTNSSARSRSTGWSWPRMPWQRNNSPDPNTSRFHQNLSSPDSQYGFSNNATVTHTDNIINPEQIAAGTHATPQSFNVVASNLPYGVWGPPPPYSDPNSPARRGVGLYQHQPMLQTNAAAQFNAMQLENAFNTNLVEQQMSCLNNRISVGIGGVGVNVSGISGVGGGGIGVGYMEQSINNSLIGGNCCPQTSSVRNLAKRKSNGQNIVGNVSGTRGSLKLKTDYENTPSDSDGGVRERFSNTLPTLRKVKKRIDVNGIKSIGSNSQQTQRINIQQVFPFTHTGATENNLEHPNLRQNICEPLVDTELNTNKVQQQMPHQHKRRHENQINNKIECDAVKQSAGQQQQHQQQQQQQQHQQQTQVPEVLCDPTESEVYFADVSSCCNVSVKNDNYYEDANQSSAKHSHQNSNCSHNSQNSGSMSGSNNNEDYLAQRFGQRENSIRSRLPFPQIRLSNDYEENLNISKTTKTVGGATAVATAVGVGNLMQKDISQHSMCSIESEAKTECTDLSPSTPCGGNNKFVQTPTNVNEQLIRQQQQQQQQKNFVASYIPPYATESQSLEAHRRSTKNIHELLLATEAHYEVINDNAPIPTSRSSHKHTTHNALKPRIRTRSKERLIDATVTSNYSKDNARTTTDRTNL